MKKFPFTHKLVLTLIDKQIPSTSISEQRVEIDEMSEINSTVPFPLVAENKIEPLEEEYPIFYTTTLHELIEKGYEVSFKPLNQ